MSMLKYDVPEFNDLKTSTRTIMAYSNIKFNLEDIFYNVGITYVDTPLTKKKKNIDKKAIRAPPGAIIGIKFKNLFRGINYKKKKKYFCHSGCRPMDGEDEILTVLPFTQKKEGAIFKGKKYDDVYEILYKCEKCGYTTDNQCKELGKLSEFLNQSTVILSLGDYTLNIMIFRTKNNDSPIKIAGNKDDDDSIRAIRVLWQRHVSKIPGASTLRGGKDDVPTFIFDLVMRNMDFKLGFPIDKDRFKKFMNSDRYKDKVRISWGEPTSSTSVSVVMYSDKPDMTYRCLYFPEPNVAKLKKVKENPYIDPKKAVKQKNVTFIVFSSSKIIITGRYPDRMRELYEYFVPEFVNNRELIEEKIIRPKMSLADTLKQMNFN